MIPETGLKGRYFLPMTTGVSKVVSDMIACAAARNNHRTATSLCADFASKGKVRTITGPEGGFSSHLGRFTPQERPSTHYIGGLMGPTVGLDRCEKSRPHWNLIPGPFSL
jgi:hypothetical protein